MNESAKKVIEALKSAFMDVDWAPFPLLTGKDAAKEQTCLRLPKERLLEAMRFLREDGRCRFEQLCDLTCVDYLNFPKARDRYGVTYSLLSLSLEQRIWAKCFVNDPNPEVPSVTSIWRGAEWMEREVFDMFGVRFSSHPDLRRILTWDEFEAHPLRKDYPLRGQGEREDYEVLTPESS